MIDADGFRPNVGIVVLGPNKQVLWARRVGQDAWQFPQGGIQRGESPEEALFRELYEELGLQTHDVDIMGCTNGWLRYRLPRRYIRRNKKPICIGQKQKWFLLRMTCEESEVKFDTCEKPEFEGWRWVDYWYPPNDVIFFKRPVYRRALRELEPLLGEGVCSIP
ncbi:MAG: RNA pyrophosphohydrolase [Oceanococcus sp.]